MRVVIDTNVFVSSFFGGTPRAIIDLWKQGQITLCLSSAILDEYVAVLRRLGLGETAEFDELLALLAGGLHLLFTTKTPELHVVEDDPDDDKFIACAVALRARRIITGDRPFLAIGSYMDIQVVTPRQFLQEWHQSSG